MVANKGLRITRQRQIILEELKRVTSHPTADEVFQMVRKRLPRISLGTVYRNLETLADGGLIQQLLMSGSQRRYDGNAVSHYHVRCLQCDRVSDLMEEPEPPVIPDGCAGDGFEIMGYRLELLGVCPQCGDAVDVASVRGIHSIRTSP